MQLFVKLKTEYFGEYNIYDILHSPEIFNTESFECVERIYSSSLYNKYMLKQIHKKVNFKKDDDKDTLIDFIVECEYLGFRELLKDTAIKKYLRENAMYLYEKFKLKSENIFYTDGELMLDYRLEKVYKLENDKLVYIGNYSDIMLNYELSWFDKLYFKNINEKRINKILVNINRKKLGKQKFIEELKEIFSDNLIDVSSVISDLVYMDFDYPTRKKYVDYFMTEENYNEFKRRKYT